MVIIKSHQPGKMLNGHQRNFCPACPQTFLKILTRLTTGDQSDQSKFKLLCDNLNTHPIASLYEAFDADEAPLF